ncbi:MAG: hypothetical protein ABI347_10985 [Nitrososphaera sp.]
MREEAAKEGSSVNSIIASVLRHHTLWGRHQKRLGFMPMHKSMIIAMMDRMTLQEAEAIGRAQKEQTVRDFLMFHSAYNLETFLEWIDLRCKVLGFQLIMTRRRADPAGSLCVMIHHDMGQKWSYYYKGMFSAALEDLVTEGGSSSAGFETGNSSFSLNIAEAAGCRTERVY